MVKSRPITAASSAPPLSRRAACRSRPRTSTARHPASRSGGPGTRVPGPGQRRQRRHAPVPVRRSGGSECGPDRLDYRTSVAPSGRTVLSVVRVRERRAQTPPSSLRTARLSIQRGPGVTVGHLSLRAQAPRSISVSRRCWPPPRPAASAATTAVDQPRPGAAKRSALPACPLLTTGDRRGPRMTASPAGPHGAGGQAFEEPVPRCQAVGPSAGAGDALGRSCGRRYQSVGPPWPRPARRLLRRSHLRAAQATPTRVQASRPCPQATVPQAWKPPRFTRRTARPRTWVCRRDARLTGDHAKPCRTGHRFLPAPGMSRSSRSAAHPPCPAPRRLALYRGRVRVNCGWAGLAGVADRFGLPGVRTPAGGRVILVHAEARARTDTTR